MVTQVKIPPETQTEIPRIFLKKILNTLTIEKLIVIIVITRE
jgi:hypothetical protein